MKLLSHGSLLLRGRNSVGPLLLGITFVLTLCCRATESNDKVDSSRMIDGVIAKFKVISPVLDNVDAPLKVSLVLRNTNARPISFQFIGPLVPSIRVYDASRRELPYRRNSSLGEYPSARVKLPPKGEFRTVLFGELSEYYDLSPGTYYIRFLYDLRLIDNRKLQKELMRKYRSENIALWNTNWYRLCIKNTGRK
jgi:hypothetical protein